jgi:hypothetical protein
MEKTLKITNKKRNKIDFIFINKIFQLRFSLDDRNRVWLEIWSLSGKLNSFILSEDVCDKIEKFLIDKNTYLEVEVI